MSAKANQLAFGASPRSVNLYWMPAELLAPEEFASVRRPIWNMKAWLSTGGAVPAL
jgi:hypothetical protein